MQPPLAGLVRDQTAVVELQCGRFFKEFEGDTRANGRGEGLEVDPAMP